MIEVVLTALMLLPTFHIIRDNTHIDWFVSAVYIGIFFTLSLNTLIRRNIVFPFPKWFVLILMLFIIREIFLSLTLEQLYFSVQYVWRFFLLLIPFIILITRYNNYRKLHNLLLYWVLFGSLFAMMFLYDLGTSTRTGMYYKLHSILKVVNINTYAYLFTQMSFISFFMITQDKRNRMIYIVTLSLFILAVLFSISRGALLSLVVGFTVIFLYYLKDLKIGKILKIASIVMSILLVVFMLLVTNIISLEYFWLSKQGLGESVQSSVLKKSIESAKVRSLEIRKFQNKWYWERFLEKPLLGHGLSLNDYFVNFFGKEIGTIHNKYIEILAITGIIGFAIYFIMLAGTLKLILSVIRKDWKILFILMFSAIIIQGIFAPIDTNFWIFLGLLLAVLKITRLETRNAEN